ncbi:MAG: DUF1499 domain-containing protein [Actinomycetota bacterium]|nr:DUF1499 domain-containing protein [Actinomycetota bacterium]
MTNIERTSRNSARVTREYPISASKLLDGFQQAIEKLPRWEIESRNVDNIEATRKTAIFRFTDDVTVVVEAHGDGSRAVISSSSRVGKGDLGQNPRNVEALLEAVERELAAEGQPTT